MEPPLSLPPPPPIPPNVTPKVVSMGKRAVMERRGFGTKGQKIQLVTNHFRVSLANTDGCFFQYSVSPFLAFSIIRYQAFVYLSSALHLI